MRNCICIFEKLQGKMFKNIIQMKEGIEQVLN